MRATAAADHPLGFLPEQFWSRVERTDTGCWFWTGSYGVGGYGQLSVRKERGQKTPTTLIAHRMAWELLVGPIPDGMEVDHRCRNRCCVRPAHLRLLTPASNKQYAARARWAEKDVGGWGVEVRRAITDLDMPMIELAPLVGVSEATLSTWANGHRLPHESNRERFRSVVAELLSERAAA